MFIFLTSFMLSPTGNAFIAAVTGERKAVLIGTSCDKHVVCQKLSAGLTTTQVDYCLVPHKVEEGMKSRGVAIQIKPFI